MFAVNIGDEVVTVPQFKAVVLVDPLQFLARFFEQHPCFIQHVPVSRAGEVTDHGVVSNFGVHLRDGISSVTQFLAFAKSEIRLFSVHRILCQYQWPDLHSFVSRHYRVHVLAIVEVSVTCRVHTNLHPVVTFHRHLCSGRSLLWCNGFPVTLHHSNRCFRFAACNGKSGFLHHAKGRVGDSSNAFVSDGFAGRVSGFLLMYGHHPHTVISVGRDIKSKTDRVSCFQGFRWDADAFNLVAGETSFHVSHGSRRWDFSVRCDRLELVDQLAVLFPSNRTFFDALCCGFQSRYAIKHISLTATEFRRSFTAQLFQTAVSKESFKSSLAFEDCLLTVGAYEPVSTSHDQPPSSWSMRSMPALSWSTSWIRASRSPYSPTLVRWSSKNWSRNCCTTGSPLACSYQSL